MATDVKAGRQEPKVTRTITGAAAALARIEISKNKWVQGALIASYFFVIYFATSNVSDPNPRVVARHGLQMMIGALLSWDDGGYHATIIWVERTPIGWTGYAVCAGYGGWWGSARRTGR